MTDGDVGEGSGATVQAAIRPPAPLEISHNRWRLLNLAESIDDL
jgi:hypothetical protein